MKGITSFVILSTLMYTVYGVVDHSPYCSELAKITSLCNELFIHMMCPLTCGSAPKKFECGIRKYGDTDTYDENKRKKRFDEEESDEIIKEEDEGGIHPRFRRIVGGTQTVKGAYPWHVALYYKGKQRCAGALLSPNWVVTAAHCFDDDTTSKNENDWFIIAGEYSLFVSEPEEELRKIKKIIIHELNYKYWKAGYKNVSDDYDIALLKLSRPVKLKDNSMISPICLASQNMFSSHDLCKTMGWGATETTGKMKDALHDATVKLVPRDICNLPISNNGTVHERALCAGYRTGHADACKRDSGGSLACKKGKHWFGVGLVSSGFQCGNPHAYGVYTNLPLMKSWIIRTLLSYDDATNSIISIFERVATLNPFGFAPQVKKGIYRPEQ